MFYKLDIGEFAKIREAEKITFTDYGLKDDLISVESMMAAIEDLLIEIDRLEQKYNDFEQEVEDNYKPYTKEEMYGVSNRDFI